MKTTMKQLLDELRERVRANLDAIHNNEQEVRKILSEPNSKERSEKLTIRFTLNKRILEENKDNIEIQNQIVNFLILYKEVPDFSEKIKSLKGGEQAFEDKAEDESANKSENRTTSHSARIEAELKKITKKQTTNNLFDLTISGEQPFNSFHPLFNDEEFFDKLLDYYLQNEMYEVCAQLKKIKFG